MCSSVPLYYQSVFCNGVFSPVHCFVCLRRLWLQREGFEPGKRSRRDSLSSQSSCSYTAASNFAGIYPEDSVSQISQM